VGPGDCGCSGGCGGGCVKCLGEAPALDQHPMFESMLFGHTRRRAA
jgi:hypothetical protein